jgi:hypothetical protein
MEHIPNQLLYFLACFGIAWLQLGYRETMRHGVRNRPCGAGSPAPGRRIGEAGSSV